MISRLISRFQNGPNEDMVTTVWQEYKDLVSQIDAFIDSRQYRSVESLQLQLDEKVLSLSKLLLSAGISGETILFYGLPLNITGDVRKGKDWTNKTNHWFIGSDSSLWVAWRQDAAYFCYVKEHVRDSDYDNFTRTVSRGDEIVKIRQSNGLEAPISKTNIPSLEGPEAKNEWKDFRDLVSQIDDFINSRQYRSVESLKLQLDAKVLSLSKLLLSAGISGETILFYGLPLNITGDVKKGNDWGDKTNHWFISSDSSLWVAWRQDAAYFCYVKEHVRVSDYDNFTRTVSRGDEIFEKYFNIQFSSENHVSLHADNLKNRSATTESIELALKKSSKKWGRGKIMLVGEGRAGKTALSNSIIGNPFRDTESTIGIQQLTCDVKYAKKGDGSWSQCEKPEKELESALAWMIASADSNKAGKETSSHESTDEVTTNHVATVIRKELEIEMEAKTALRQESNSNILNNMTTVGVEDLSMIDRNQADKNVVQEANLKKEEVDEAMVLKCLSNAVETKSDLMISLFDYGGQSVFSVIHHLFLTKNGVYLVCFNMQWLIGDEATRESHIAYLRHWLNSIIIHTYDAASKSTAPIAFVGTRKDMVTSPSDHEEVSTILFSAFHQSRAWPSVIQNSNAMGRNGNITFWFFPIDNQLGRSDKSLQKLLECVEYAIDESAYTHRDVPLSWLKALDVIQTSGKVFLQMHEFCEVMVQCGIYSQEGTSVLHFFNEMGILMWWNKPGLQDVIILDPVKYFVEPATVIICKHNPKGNDATHHFSDTHRECSRKYPDEWNMLIRDGILHEDLLTILWKDYKDRVGLLLVMLETFGLIVPLQINSKSTYGKQFLVPALLPNTEITLSSLELSLSSQYYTCFLCFSSSSHLLSSITITQDDLKQLAFLPHGMMERITGKIVEWCQVTSRIGGIDLNSIEMTKDVVSTLFGGQQYRITLCPNINCIRLDVAGSYPLPVYDRVIDLAQMVIKDCMNHLQCFSALYFSTNSIPTSQELFDIAFSKNDVGLLIPLDSLRNAIEHHSPLTKRGGHNLLSVSDIKCRYGPWLQIFDLLASYDIFLSYRWGDHDDRFVSAVFDMLRGYCVGTDNRAIGVFLDKKRLKEGRRFDVDFAKALTSSTMIVPIISPQSLNRFVHHNPQNVDNLLLEWCMAMQCFSSSSSSVKMVFPIMFGTRTFKRNEHMAEVCEISNLFTEDILNQLSCEFPKATLEKAVNMLSVSGVEISNLDHFMNRSVKDIVKELMTFQCILAWQIPYVRFLSECTNTLWKVIQGYVLSNQSDYEKQDKIIPEVSQIDKPTTVSSANENSSQSDHLENQIWAMLKDEKCHTDHLKMAEILDSLGVLSGSDLRYLESTDMNSVIALLKPVQRKKFTALFKTVFPNDV